MMQALIGYVALALILYFLISGKGHPLVVFTVIPYTLALLYGFSLDEINGFIKAGMNSSWSSLVLFMFSIMYFSMMHDVGLFEPIIRALTPKKKSSVALVLLSTLIITYVGHLDGSGTTTFIIVLAACLPMTDSIKVNRKTVLLLMLLAMTGSNLVPWGGPTQIAAVASDIDINELFRHVAPSMIIMIGISLLLVPFLARIEMKRGAGNQIAPAVQEQDASAGDAVKFSDKKWIFNAVLTLAVLGILFSGKVTTYVCFIIGCALAFLINFPKPKEIGARVKKYADQIIGMVSTIAAVGVFIGIMTEGGFITAMASVIANLIPQSLVAHTHWIVAFFGCLWQMLLGTSAYYRVLLPLIISIVEPYGVEAMDVAAAFLTTGTFGSLLCPSVAALYVGLGLADVQIGDHIKYCIKYMLPLSFVALILATLLGVTVF